MKHSQKDTKSSSSVICTSESDSDSISVHLNLETVQSFDTPPLIDNDFEDNGDNNWGTTSLSDCNDKELDNIGLEEEEIKQ